MSWVMNESVGKIIISVNMHYLLFLRDIYGRKITLEETDDEESKLVNELKGIEEGVKPVQKVFSKPHRIIF